MCLCVGEGGWDRNGIIVVKEEQIGLRPGEVQWYTIRCDARMVTVCGCTVRVSVYV